MPLTLSTSKRLLREAVALLDGAPVLGAARQWCAERDAFLADVEAALGVSGTGNVLAALTPKGSGQRGPDKKPRRRASEKPVDLSPATVPVSPPSREDASHPQASPYDDMTTVEQIAAVHTLAALRFQQLSL